jgi:predicted nucleic acid-binding protein
MIAVLDASVALKWQFQDEEATEQATELLMDYVNGKIQLIAPNLLSYEIVSAVNVAINRKRIPETVGHTAIQNLNSLGIELRPFDDLIEDTFFLSRRHNLSPYDCAYIALAEKEKCDFLTGDKRLFNAVNKRLICVKWIGHYHSTTEF